MDRRLNPILAFTAAALLAAVVLPSSAQAQDMGRFRVLIPDLFPTGGADDDFGKDMADELREIVSGLATHEAVEEGDIKDALRSNQLKMEDLDCIKTIQLSSVMNVQVAFCASYRQVGEKQYELFDISFYDVAARTPFPVDGFQAAEKEEQAASQQIVDAFDEYVQQVRFRQFCYDYAQSRNWEDALRNCNQALDLNPEDKGVLYQRALIRYETEEFETALVDLKAVLELEPLDENALQRAGYVATQLGRNDEGRAFYGRYLELNPGAVAVRRRIAYDMHLAGDPEGAMLFINEGIEVEEDPELWQDYGNYAFAAADKAMREAAIGAENGGGLTPEVEDYYRKATEAYLLVFEAKGTETPINALQNVIRAFIQLDELDRAVSVGREVLDVHAEEAGLWAVYADALQKADDLDGAIDALAEVDRLDPEYPNLHVRQGNWLLQADRAEEAVPFLQMAVERGQDPDLIARLLLARAHANGVRRNNWSYAIGLLELAKNSFETGTEQLKELNFWHGYSIYQRAVKDQEPATPATARTTLPQFQRALALFQQAQGYGAQQNIDINQYLQNTGTYIEIQEAILKRAGGGR